MSDILELSAAQAAEAIAAGSLSGGELFDLYRSRADADRTAGEDGLNCFTWVAPDVSQGATVVFTVPGAVSVSLHA